MAFLSRILKPHFTATGIQGVQGTSNSTQGVQGVQGVQGSAGLLNGTLITNTQPGSYTLQATDVGEVISGVSTVGIPSDVFNPGENVVILNNDLNRTILNIEGKNPAVSIYQAGVGAALTENRKIKNKSFISIFCTRLNEFILSGSFLPTIEATGGTIVDSGGYRIHVFTGTGPFNVSYIGPPSYNNVEYVVVAGGGGSGNGPGPTANSSGGGGAGGFRTGINFPVTVQDYTITVGGGGSPTTLSSDSVFSTITSSGGGLGGSGSAGGNGGSGGGGGTPGSAGGTGNRLTGTITPAPTQGNNGGSSSPLYYAGGGGGAGAAGTNANYPGTPGTGGIGTSVTWVPASYGTPGPAPGRYFSGGGGGGTYAPSSPGPVSGGAGGGGTGGDGPAPTTAGSTNTGGGGGGGGSPFEGTGGSGGSGIVIIRYLL
jgi:hypothetical protein